MKNEQQGQNPKPSLCVREFTAVAIDDVHVDFIIKPISPLFHVDGRKIFAEAERDLVQSFSVDQHEGVMRVRVELKNLEKLVERIGKEYRMEIATFGLQPKDLIRYKNGVTTPCDTMHEAMTMALSHK